MSGVISGTRVYLVGRIVGTNETVQSDLFFEDGLGGSNPVTAPKVGERYYWGVWSDKYQRIVGALGVVLKSEPCEVPTLGGLL